ncbi:hypothetical protein TRIATDRAFT_285432 [Trichoderma atroviride IMI 206040]|uniref:Uncharacterized protein n=1 Tax=Hypocrea atroviridis (strain ATCC 20476 / IMI 206040) TaxID=452589 RepID=G9P2N7_HYPAI|nr:uncharacterized protein TRIATDRAFT_285432 [Trichoderma atroviride IMI 206040]EHK42718.1 hypothetical protein TRIATDRAFT_285432 [Trichoderma atroviride IMI 206040]
MARQSMRVRVSKDPPSSLRGCVQLLIWPIQKKKQSYIQTHFGEFGQRHSAGSISWHFRGSRRRKSIASKQTAYVQLEELPSTSFQAPSWRRRKPTTSEQTTCVQLEEVPSTTFQAPSWRRRKPTMIKQTARVQLEELPTSDWKNCLQPTGRTACYQLEGPPAFN